MIPGRSGGGLLAGHALEDPQAGFGSRHLVFQEALQHLCLLHFLLGILHGLGACLAGLFAGLGLGLFQLDLGVLLGRNDPAQTYYEIGRASCRERV